MVLVAIGTIGKAVAKVAYDGFDDIQVLSYNDLNDFMHAVNMHTLEIHRMIMSDNAFDLEVVSDDIIDAFVNLVQRNYPAAKLITVSKDREMTEYFAQLLMGIDYVHICIGDGENKFKATHKFLEDLISLSTEDIKAKYKNIVFNREVTVSSVEVDVVDENDIEGLQNSDIPGIVQNPHKGKEGKRSFLDKVLGRGPKQSNQSVIKQGGPEEIGQGFGVQEFSTDNTNPFEGEEGGFSVFDPDESDIGIDIPVDNNVDYSMQNQEDPFNQDFSDFKQNFDEEQTGFDKPQEISDEDSYSDNFDMNKENQEEALEEDTNVFEDFSSMGNSFEEPFESQKIEEDIKEEVEDSFEVYGKNEPVEDEKSENLGFRPPVVTPIDVSRIRDQIENTNLNIDMDNIPKRPSRVNKPLDVVENEGLDDFGDNFTDLMQNYEESNRKVIEKRVVETKIVTVGSASKFRNKNGVRLIVMIGDRRVGITKLSLNLCTKFARSEKVLYVDFDRLRHGSLGYIDIDNIMEEPEHIRDGLNHYKTNRVLTNVVHLYGKGNFYTLTSMYGSEVSDEQINIVEKNLVSQKDFQTVIIDCPIENMYLLDDILRVCNVVICAEDDKVGVLNLLTSLGLYCSDTKQLLNIFEKSSFVVGRKNNIDKFMQVLAETVDLFDMDEAGLDWTKVEVIGTTKNVPDLAERMSS